MMRKKLLIELFGNYWHTAKARETAEQRAARFREHGFETLVISEEEMDDEQLITDRIRRFCGEIYGKQRNSECSSVGQLQKESGPVTFIR